MSSSSYSCPACGENSINKLGQLCELSGMIDLPTPGNLYKCISCSLLFRHPYISESDLEKAYSDFFSPAWADTSERPDFDIAASFIRGSYSNGSILDIGCFQGDFLNLLPNTFRKYGIELSEPARKIARQYGIELVGTSINHIEINRPMFHAITLLDVIEHLQYPLKSLSRIVKLLFPGGIIILSTGNTDAIPWRLMRLDYWYYVTEHVSFFNPRWFYWAAWELNLNLVLIKRFSHFKGSALNRWRQFAQCLTYWVLKNVKHPTIHKMISTVYPFNRISEYSPPSTHLWKDHILVVFKAID